LRQPEIKDLLEHGTASSAELFHFLQGRQTNPEDKAGKAGLGSVATPERMVSVV
jgi:hypothetical protein